MRRGAWARALGALLPADARREMFEPALHDLHGEAARNGRGTGIATLGLFLECWRLAPAEVFAMLIQDLRHAVRLLIRERGFTLAAVLTLALGVGANVAVFGVVNAALLRPLPYPDAERLVIVEHRDRRTGITKPFIAAGDFADLRARQQSLEALAAYGWGRGTVFDRGEPFDLEMLAASPDLFAALRARAALGRTLGPGDSRHGAPPVVMLGYAMWQQRYGGDPRIVGRSIDIDGIPRQVVGIMPAGFRFPTDNRSDAIVPIEIPEQAPADRKSGWFFAAGRLKAGVTREQAAADLSSISRQMEREFPEANQGSEYFERTVREAMVGETRRPLLLLLGAVGLVLLIACVNVANLLVARGVGRRQEMAVRVALGAGRGRLVAQALTESLVLALGSGAAGVLVARWATPVLVALVPSSVQIPELGALGLDGRVLAFTAGLTMLTTVVFGLVTALGTRVDNAVGVLVSPGRVCAGAAARRASAVLVVAETALAIVLLTGAGLVLRSFSRLVAVDPGFDTDRVLTLEVALPASRYREQPARQAFYARAAEALGRIAGVQAAGTAEVMPLTGNNWTGPFDRADHPAPAGHRPPDVGWQSASGGYFRALRIPLRAGRLFDARDGPGAPPVVIISEAVRDLYFAGENPLGHRIRLGDDGTAEIVGVVGNIRRAALTDAPRADMYFPAEHAPPLETTLFIGSAGDPRAAVAAVETTLRSIEPLIVLRRIQTLKEVARQSVQITRLALTLLSAFAFAALALAAVGIYGVMSYSVRQRTREIGTRLALGATSGNILWLVMRDGLAVAGLGCGIGLVTGTAAARFLSALLFGTSPIDPATLVSAAALLLAVALLACYLPARRATRLDPVRSLGSGL